jgi:glycosyltransferase involved in cell wall biosynthesis
MKILALPRGVNPYQELLYRPMRERGAVVAYAGECTKSRTLNQLLLPVELAVMRLRGFRRLHVHWLYNFRFVGSDRLPVLARLSRSWLAIVLYTARLLGYRTVWTVHNVVPHSPIFDDDAAARRLLVRQSKLVIGHGQNALDGLANLGASAARSVIISPGAYDLPAFAQLPNMSSAGARTVLYFGQIEPYKGVEDLLGAVRDASGDLRVVVAGACSDSDLRERIEASADSLGERATLLLRFVEESELGGLFAEAHAVVLPFREVTTSSSVLLAMASGRPVVVPRLPAFDEIPEEALIRYYPGTSSLIACLASVETAPVAQLRAIGERGRAFSTRNGWDAVAVRTMQEMRFS